MTARILCNVRLSPTDSELMSWVAAAERTRETVEGWALRVLDDAAGVLHSDEDAPVRCTCCPGRAESPQPISEVSPTLSAP